MSYCRAGVDSSVYVIAHVDGGMACYCGRDEADRLLTKPEMLGHLLAHRASGDKVPQRALDRLVKEINEESGENIEAHVAACLIKNVCPYSGLDGPECKSWLCDCFEFEELWGVSQK
jgi:hypothetical protein